MNTSPPFSSWPPVRSTVPGALWPALPEPKGAVLASLLAQMEQTQWLAPESLEEIQMRQLAVVLDHARQHSPFYRERLAGCGPVPESGLQSFIAGIPLLRRADIQSQRERIDCRWYPPEHGRTTVSQSTGSTGEPVAVRRTELNALIWMANTLRDHLWQRRDFRRPLAIIRALIAEDGPVSWPDWGTPVRYLFHSGPSFALNLQTDVARQAAWLRGIGPGYLLTYPNNLSALLDIVERESAAAAGMEKLVQIRTIGETLHDAVRERCDQLLGIPVSDVYTSQEIGVIAIECPDGGGYHVMSESVVVELLREDGSACAPGDVGRVVVTDLHNHATPLIRYETGDLAVAESACSCGRGLPRLRRIIGRERNLLRLPDGRRHWPLVGAFGFREIAPVRQYQVVQRSLERVTLRLATERPLRTDEESRLAAVLTEFLGYPFAVDFEYFPEGIPRGRGGKFEDFYSEVR